MNICLCNIVCTLVFEVYIHNMILLRYCCNERFINTPNGIYLTCVNVFCKYEKKCLNILRGCNLIKHKNISNDFVLYYHYSHALQNVL